ncbi:MAG: hypothetical protein HY319_02530 [Armatimonadetes bacterium]|nr:hypothetical protein [Armatimonadota bacterium]
MRPTGNELQASDNQHLALLSRRLRTLGLVVCMGGSLQAALASFHASSAAGCGHLPPLLIAVATGYLTMVAGYLVFRLSRSFAPQPGGQGVERLVHGLCRLERFARWSAIGGGLMVLLLEVGIAGVLWTELPSALASLRGMF